MSPWWPLVMLLSIVGLLLFASRYPVFQSLFRWLPLPLWCYGLPMIANVFGWLPAGSASYGWITNHLFPIALGLLLLGVDLAALRHVGAQALLAMLIGVATIVLGGPLLGWMFRSHLPAEAWKGIGILAATWTGGSMNMLALRGILDAPDAVFAPLVVVDALVAYSWMACLMAARGLTPILNRWLKTAETDRSPPSSPDVSSTAQTSPPQFLNKFREAKFMGCAIAVGLTMGCRGIARILPTGGLVASTAGWTVLLVTTLSLGLSCVPALRRLGQEGSAVGYPCLYLVLAALGAQASLSMLMATPVWLAIGVGWLIFHAVMLLLAGRAFRLPIGVLATASQANIGGVVSAPLVGAVYGQELAAIGLCLAIAGNAAGTYLGLAAASLSRWLGGG